MSDQPAMVRHRPTRTNARGAHWRIIRGGILEKVHVPGPLRRGLYLIIGGCGARRNAKKAHVYLVDPRWSLLANHSLRPISGQHNFVRAGQIVVTHGDASELIGQLDQVRAVPPRMGAPSVAAPAQREDFTQGRLPVHGVRRRYVQDGERVAVPSGTPGSALRRGRTRGPPLRGAAGVPSWQPAASSATHASL